MENPDNEEFVPLPVLGTVVGVFFISIYLIVTYLFRWAGLLPYEPEWLDRMEYNVYHRARSHEA